MISVISVISYTGGFINGFPVFIFLVPREGGGVEGSNGTTEQLCAWVDMGS